MSLEIGIAAVAFTGVWFLQEQAQRVMKQERDKESFTETTNRFKDVLGNLDHLYKTVSAQFGALDETIAEQFGTLADALKALQRQRDIMPETPSRERIDADVAFLDQATAAFRAGLPLPGLLAAAVGFEDAVRRAGERFGLKEYRAGAGRILYQLHQMQIINGAVFEKLRALMNVRNHLVHALPSDVLDPAGAQQALEDFHWGIEYLTSLGD
jgi:hypothetical protein